MKNGLFKSGMWGIVAVFLFIVMSGCSSHEEKIKGAGAAEMPTLGNPDYVGSER